MTIEIKDMTEDHTEIMETIWENGAFLKEYTLEEIRTRANA
jgi:hypothetical protein